MHIEESPPAAPKAPARVVTPSAASSLPSSQIEQRLAAMAKQRDARQLEELELGEKQGRALAEHGAEDPDIAEAQAAAGVSARNLHKACEVLAVDLAVAKKREADEERRATLKSLSLILDRRAAVGDELEIVLEQLCTKLLQVRDVQREALVLMQRGKKAMPLEERQGVRILDSVQQFANPDMLRRWIAMGVRHRVPDLFDAELGTMAVRFGDSVRTTNLQAMSEMRWLLNIDESEVKEG